MWSGGLDSTALILHYLEKGYAVDVICIKDDCLGPFKIAREEKARAAIKPYFNNKKVLFLEDAKVTTPFAGNLIFNQMPTWLLMLMTCSDARHTEVAIGYVMGDDAISYLPEIKRLWNASSFLFGGRRAMPKLCFPIAQVTKGMIWRAFPDELKQHVTWCENCGDADFCDNCTPCKKAICVDIQGSAKYHRNQYLEKIGGDLIPTVEVGDIHPLNIDDVHPIEPTVHALPIHP